MTSGSVSLGSPAGCSGLAGMIGFYLYYTGKRVGSRPEDRQRRRDPRGCRRAGALQPLELVAAGVGRRPAPPASWASPWAWWIVFIAGGMAVVALVGWVYEYSRGDHAHYGGPPGLKVQIATTAGPTRWWGPPSFVRFLVSAGVPRPHAGLRSVSCRAAAAPPMGAGRPVRRRL